MTASVMIQTRNDNDKLRLILDDNQDKYEKLNQ